MGSLTCNCRYEREFNRGHRPLLKAVLQHDEVASAAMVLMVASVHLPPGAADGGGGDSTGTASAATVRPQPARACLCTVSGARLAACRQLCHAGGSATCRCSRVGRLCLFLKGRSTVPFSQGVEMCTAAAAGAD